MTYIDIENGDILDMDAIRARGKAMVGTSYIDIANGAIVGIDVVRQRGAGIIGTVTADSLGIAPIEDGTPPPVPRHHDLVLGQEVVIEEKRYWSWTVAQDGHWHWTWTVEPWPPERVAADIAARWARIRRQRDQLLADSDWTALPSTPMADELRATWQTYRQALRDITAQPDPYDVIWPTAPN
jgi:hypothetical protein